MSYQAADNDCQRLGARHGVVVATECAPRRGDMRVSRESCAFLAIHQMTVWERINKLLVRERGLRKRHGR